MLAIFQSDAASVQLRDGASCLLGLTLLQTLEQQGNGHEIPSPSRPPPVAFKNFTYRQLVLIHLRDGALCSEADSKLNLPVSNEREFLFVA